MWRALIQEQQSLHLMADNEEEGDKGAACIKHAWEYNRTRICEANTPFYSSEFTNNNSTFFSIKHLITFFSPKYFSFIIPLYFGNQIKVKHENSGLGVISSTQWMGQIPQQSRQRRHFVYCFINHNWEQRLCFPSVVSARTIMRTKKWPRSFSACFTIL